MTSIKVAVGDLECVDIAMPPELLSRTAQLAIALVSSKKAHKMLSQTKILRVNKKLFACEHFALILALKRVHPGLQLECLAIDCKSISEAHHVIHNQVKLASLSTLNALEVPAFEAAHRSQSKFMSVKAWAELFEVHRSTFYGHKRKFQSPPLVQDKFSGSAVDLDETLLGIPKIKEKG